MIEERIILATENIYNIICDKGQKFELEIEATDDIGIPIDFTDSVISLTVTKGKSLFLEFNTADGLTIEGNLLILYKASIDLALGIYEYNLTMVIDGASEKIMKGSLAVI